MKKEHIVVEFLPRVLWTIQIACLVLGQYYINQAPILTDNILLLILGSFLLIMGTIYFIWSFRFLAKAMFTKELVVGGPYKYARHPIYVGIYVALIGAGLLFFSSTWFLILLVFIPLWYLVCKAEEKQMTDLHGEKYLEYKKGVGMFFPKM